MLWPAENSWQNKWVLRTDLLAKARAAPRSAREELRCWGTAGDNKSLLQKQMVLHISVRSKSTGLTAPG